MCLQRSMHLKGMMRVVCTHAADDRCFDNDKCECTACHVRQPPLQLCFVQYEHALARKAFPYAPSYFRLRASASAAAAKRALSHCNLLMSCGRSGTRSACSFFCSACSSDTRLAVPGWGRLAAGRDRLAAAGCASDTAASGSRDFLRCLADCAGGAATAGSGSHASCTGDMVSCLRARAD